MASDHTEAEETVKSAEDRKAASALATLTDDASPQARADVDQAAVSAAMKKLGGGKGGANLPIRRNVKIEQADVALLVGTFHSRLFTAPGVMETAGKGRMRTNGARLTNWI